MFIQTENTPNPNSLKFLPGRKVSNNGPLEILKQEDTNNLLIKNLLQINGVTGVFLGEDFFSINKEENKPKKKLCPKLEKNVKINPNIITFKLKLLNIKNYEL